MEVTSAVRTGPAMLSTSQRLGYAGAGLIAVGSFLPLAGHPVVGQVSAMQFGPAGTAFLLFAAVSAFLVWRGWMRGLWLTGGYMTYSVGSLIAGLGGTASSGMFQPGVEWGAFVLLAGSVLLLIGAFRGNDRGGR